MLELFRHKRPRPSDGSPTSQEEEIRSHVFPKFLKRLGSKEHPAVLDLGRLSGGNIEILARLGCRVQVEDLVRGSEPERAPEPEPERAHPAGPAPAGTLPPVPEAHAGGPPSTAPGAPAMAALEAPPHGAVAAGPAADGRTDGAAGAPSGAPAAGEAPAPAARRHRHIVLPPRTFGRPAPGAAAAARPAAGAQRTPLAARLDYADQAFDAVVGWDLFNYYEPASARRVAAEVTRLLRPGGLIFACFHARSRVEGPDGPRRYRILDEQRLTAEIAPGRVLPRHLYQNRDIERMFDGLRIVELYFLKNGVREMLLEKRGGPPAPGVPAARPRSRFRID